jgi:hypothetical protein
MLHLTPELDKALDGQAKWMISIVTQYARKQQKTGFDLEDFLGGFILYYVKFRDKYDPSRGRRTTFVFQLFRTYAYRYNRKNRISCKNVDADLPLSVVEYDEDENALIAASSKCRRESVERYARDLGWSVKRTKETLDGLRDKVRQKQTRVRAFVKK